MSLCHHWEGKGKKRHTEKRVAVEGPVYELVGFRVRHHTAYQYILLSSLRIAAGRRAMGEDGGLTGYDVA